MDISPELIRIFDVTGAVAAMVCLLTLTWAIGADDEDHRSQK